MPNVNLIAIIARVTQVVTRGDGGRIGGSEGRKKRVAVYKVDSMIANPKNRWRIDRIDGPSSQSIENEDHDIAGMNAHRRFLPGD